GRRKNAVAPFTVQTEPGQNYLVKLIRIDDPGDQMLIYVKGGHPYSTKVPLGSYYIRCAGGEIWYGREHLFGPDTQFFRLRTKVGAVRDEFQVFRFYREGSKIMGMTLSFKRVVDGNMEQEKISRGEF